MKISLMRRLSFKLRRILGRPVTCDDIWAMCDEGARKEAYVTIGGIIENHPEVLEHGGTCTLWANLVLAATDDVCRAIELLDKAHELGVEDMAYYHAVRGEAMRALGNREKAMQNYEKSIAINATVLCLESYGQVLSESNDGRATEILQQLLEMDRENCTAHVYIGMELAKSGDRDRAMLMAQKAQELTPSAEDMLSIGLLYYELEEFPATIKMCLEAHRLGNEDKAGVYATIAASHLALGQPDEARGYAQRALSCDPGHDYANEIWREYEKRVGQGEK